jgi:hypothetical protein
MFSATRGAGDCVSVTAYSHSPPGERKIKTKVEVYLYVGHMYKYCTSGPTL